MESDRRAILVSQRITRVCIDHAVTLLTDGGFEVRLETPFSLTRADGSTRIDPRDREAAAGVLSLLHEVIEAAEFEPSGQLTIAFSDGTRLVASPHAQFEAWVVTDSSGGRVVCLPGGGVSEWSGR